MTGPRSRSNSVAALLGRTVGQISQPTQVDRDLQPLLVVARRFQKADRLCWSILFESQLLSEVDDILAPIQCRLSNRFSLARSPETAIGPNHLVVRKRLLGSQSESFLGIDKRLVEVADRHEIERQVVVRNVVPRVGLFCELKGLVLRLEISQ